MGIESKVKNWIHLILGFHFFKELINFMSTGVLPVCMSVNYTCARPGVHKNQKQVSDSLVPELQML